MQENPYQSPRDHSREQEPIPKQKPPAIGLLSLGVLYFVGNVAVFVILMAIPSHLAVAFGVAAFLVFGAPAIMFGTAVLTNHRATIRSTIGLVAFLLYSIALGFSNAWLILLLSAGA